MRPTIYSFNQWVALICDPTKNKIGSTLVLSGLDDLLKPGGNTKLVFQQLLGSDSLNNGEPTGFLAIINDLFNAIKHHWPHEESNNLFCFEQPTITSFYARHNNTADDVTYHNHSAYHLMMGFQDMIRRFAVNTSIAHSTIRPS